jgi:hypothetical protein
MAKPASAVMAAKTMIDKSFGMYVSIVSASRAASPCRWTLWEQPPAAGVESFSGRHDNASGGPECSGLSSGIVSGPVA